MAYLTNTRLENEEICKQAAEAVGFNIEFRREPMPKDPFDPDDYAYQPESLVGVYGSIYTYEPADKDHSPFWKMWDKLEDEARK